MNNCKTVSFYYPYRDRAFSLKMFQDNTSQIRGFYFTKDNINEVSKLDFASNYAIYFLFNDSEEDKCVYIGKSSNGVSRITSHKYLKDFWSYCIMFVTDNNSFDETTIDYLEYYFINKFKKSNFTLENAEERNKEPNVSLFDKPRLIDFADQIEFLLSSNNISLDFFNEINESIKYYEASKSFNSKIFIQEGKFVLAKGSEIKRPIESSKDWQYDSNFYERYNNRINTYIKEGKIVDEGGRLILTVNIPFESPTMPAVLSCGYSVNGWNFFKNLKEIR